MKEMVKVEGLIWITFGPLWNSPYGAHMNFFCPIPWVQYLFSESSIMKVRSLFRSDGAKSFREVPGGLNMYSLKDYEEVFRKSNLKILYSNLETVRNLPFSKMPILREFFVNHATFILRRDS